MVKVYGIRTDTVKSNPLLIIFVIGFSLAIPNTSYAFQSDVQDISQDKYYEAALSAINSAKESIFIVMYYISFNPFNKDSKPKRLIEALIATHKKGIKVKVILDQTMDISSQQDEAIDDWQLFKAKNITAYEILQKQGIDVSFDEPSVNTHSKVLVIDNETILLGSSNWTETALNSNVESNILIKSKKLAEDILNDFKDQKLQSPTLISSASSIKLSLSFLESPKLLSTIASSNDELAFDVYLVLCRYANPTANTLTISYDKITQDLSLTQKEPQTLINRAFAKLRDKYKLITFTQEDIFRKYQVTLHLTPQPDERKLELPITYFTYNWNNKLTLKAKVSYLVSLAYYTASDSKPWFFASQEDMQDKFHLKRWYISNGMQELRTQNIIDIRYSKFEETSDQPRLANYYKLLGLYDPKKVDERFKELSLRYGEANLQKARAYAKVVFKDNDPQAIETLLQLLTDYGEEAIKKAVTIVLKKRPDNPKRTFSYLKGIIEKSPKLKQQI